MPRKLFQPGQSGNPKGRPRKENLDQIRREQKQIVADVRQAAKEMTTDALNTLKSALTTPNAPWAAKVTAAVHLLDRGWGKPKETVDMTVKQTLEDLVLASMRRGKDGEAQESIH